MKLSSGIYIFLPLIPGFILSGIYAAFLFFTGAGNPEWFWFASGVTAYTILNIVIYYILYKKIAEPLLFLNRHFQEIRRLEKGLADPLPDFVVNSMFQEQIGSYHDLMQSLRLAFIDIFTQTAASISESSRIERKLKSYDKSLSQVLANQERMTGEFIEVNQEILNQAKAAGNLEASARKIKKFLDELNQDSSQVLSMAKAGLQSLEESEEHLSKLGRFIKENHEYTSMLVKRLADIESIITSIRELADRTNLLSLNASIEAARAGEMGRGFAVVASEVNKLADQSQFAVGEIAKTIDSLVHDIQDSARQVDEISSEMDILHSIGRKNFTGFRSIIDSVDRISSEVDEISGQYNELHDGVNFLSDSTAHMHERTDDIRSKVMTNKKYVSGLAEDIHLLAGNMDTLNNKAAGILKSLQSHGILTPQEIKNHMEAATVSHKTWIENLKKLFNPADASGVDLETDPRRCRFGVFYHNSPIPHSCSNEWSIIGDLHEKIHKSAIAIQEKLGNEKTTEAEKILKDTTGYSEELIKLLKECGSRIQS